MRECVSLLVRTQNPTPARQQSTATDSVDRCEMPTERVTADPYSSHFLCRQTSAAPPPDPLSCVPMDCLVSVQGSERQRTMSAFIQIPYQSKRLRNGCATFVLQRPCGQLRLGRVGSDGRQITALDIFLINNCLDSGGCNFLFLLFVLLLFFVGPERMPFGRDPLRPLQSMDHTLLDPLQSAVHNVFTVLRKLLGPNGKQACDKQIVGYYAKSHTEKRC